MKLSFKRAIRLAASLIKNQKELDALFVNSNQKIQNLKPGTREEKNLLGMLNTAMRMMKAVFFGDYKGMSLGAKISMVAGLLYFVTPLDMMPDMIPVAGLIDDFSVLLWVFRSMHKEVAGFEEWEAKKQVTVTH